MQIELAHLPTYIREAELVIHPWVSVTGNAGSALRVTVTLNG